MEIGIIGLPQSGKSTLFRIMTGVAEGAGFNDPVVRGVSRVPDSRFDRLASVFGPEKVTPASVPFLDVRAQEGSGWDLIRKSLVNADGILHVIDGFTTSSTEEVIRRYRKLEDELIFADLIAVEHRIERLSKLSRQQIKPDETVQARLLPRIKETLEKGETMRRLPFSPEETHALRGFAFWTLRPEVVVINERDDNRSLADEVEKTGQIRSPLIGIACRMEAEIAELAPGERHEFLAHMGESEPAFERIIRTCFGLTGRICYFTVGEDEVRAWVVPAGSTAPRAAAAIHKDFERGFIKAEVVSYDDFVACGETLAAAKAKGRQRLEGKDYIVQDGDIISFRFNV